jgi:plasmid stabilization system protein ParE
MIVEFLDEAEEELAEAALWYESRESGLGYRFRMEVGHVVRRIAEDPLLWRERRGGYRRVNCPVFPYYIPYFIRGEKIIVAAVAHARRKPGYWRDRLKQA